MSDDLLPCAFCGADPYVGEHRGNGGYMRAYVACRNNACISASLSSDASISEWNTFQAAVMKQRKKDFEAGLILAKNCDVWRKDVREAVFEAWLKNPEETQRKIDQILEIWEQSK